MIPLVTTSSNLHLIGKGGKGGKGEREWCLSLLLRQILIEWHRRRGERMVFIAFSNIIQIVLILGIPGIPGIPCIPCTPLDTSTESKSSTRLFKLYSRTSEGAIRKKISREDRDL